MTIFTIGHSTRTIGDFISLLKENDIVRLVDVRTIPKSRHNPQFGQEELSQSLRDAGIDYVRIPELGGLRHTTKESANTGWKNKSFRGYADYMQTPEFEAAIESLLRTAASSRSAVMCAEAVPWRCHRSLISDALVVRGIEVRHIISPGKTSVHKITSFARIDGERITYPPDQESLF